VAVGGEAVGVAVGGVGLRVGAAVGGGVGELVHVVHDLRQLSRPLSVKQESGSFATKSGHVVSLSTQGEKVGDAVGAAVGGGGGAVGNVVGAWVHSPHDRLQYLPPLEPQNSSSLAIKIGHDAKSSSHGSNLVGDADGAIVLIPLTPPMSSSALRRAMVGRDRISGRETSMDSSISQGSPEPRR